jgi:hypothetical protein
MACCSVIFILSFYVFNTCKYILYLFQCFSAGAEIGPHKNDHAYQFMVSSLNILYTDEGHVEANKREGFE